MGGTSEAMRELLNPKSAWKAEVGLAVKKSAEKSYQVLLKMINGEMPIRANTQFLIKSQVLITPSLKEVQEYLRENHGIKDFKP